MSCGNVSASRAIGEEICNGHRRTRISNATRRRDEKRRARARLCRITDALPRSIGRRAGRPARTDRSGSDKSNRPATSNSRAGTQRWRRRSPPSRRRAPRRRQHRSRCPRSARRARHRQWRRQERSRPDPPVAEGVAAAVARKQPEAAHRPPARRRCNHRKCRRAGLPSAADNNTTRRRRPTTSRPGRYERRAATGRPPSRDGRDRPDRPSPAQVRDRGRPSGQAEDRRRHVDRHWGSDRGEPHAAGHRAAVPDGSPAGAADPCDHCRQQADCLRLAPTTADRPGAVAANPVPAPTAQAMTWPKPWE